MSERIPDNDFAAGFVAGWQAVKGKNAGIPGIPGQPGTPGNLTPFLVGVRKGIQKATGKDWEQIASAS